MAYQVSLFVLTSEIQPIFVLGGTLEHFLLKEYFYSCEPLYLVILSRLHCTHTGQSSKLKCDFSGEPYCIFNSYLKVLCMESRTSLGSLQN